MHLTFWRKSVTTSLLFLTHRCSYHLRSMTDVTTFVQPQKAVMNVYAQWRELQATEAQLMKQVTIMELRQRERETVRIQTVVLRCAHVVMSSLSLRLAHLIFIRHRQKRQVGQRRRSSAIELRISKASLIGQRRPRGRSKRKLPVQRRRTNSSRMRAGYGA